MLTRHLVLVSLTVGCLASLAVGAESLPVGSYRLQKAQVMDNHGFGRPMTALTLLVPAGWNATGGVIWEQKPPSCGKNPTRFEWRATAPDGVSAIEILPEETWSGHNLPIPAPAGGCPNVTTTNVKDYLQWYVSRVRPGARMLDYRDRADMTESLKAYNRTEPGVGGELRSWVQGGEALLGYQMGGRDMRESVAIVVLFMHNRMSGVMPGEIREFLTISMLPGLAIRAPHGQLDFKFTELVRRSAKSDPAWSAAMAEHNQKMAGITAKGEADRFAIRTKTAQEIAEINRQGYANQQASQDRSHERFSQTIRGVDTYVDSSSNERIELPNTHDRVWRLNDGTYLLTNDANLDPNRDLGVQGRQLEVAK